RIEKAYLRYNGQYVRKGERIMDLYSPELNTIQEEHLFLLQKGSDSLLLAHSRRRMTLLGISPEQIEELERQSAVAPAIAVRSPATGYLFFANTADGAI